VGPLDEYLEQEIAGKLGYDPVRLTAPQVTLKDAAGGGDRCLMETCRAPVK
jgi:hypothetical protein